jgi:hypothetical protein
MFINKMLKRETLLSIQTYDVECHEFSLQRSSGERLENKTPDI